MRLIRLSVILLISLLFMPVTGAHAKIVKGIVGEYPVSREISLAQAEAMALQDAKAKALREAGITENIQQFMSLEETQSSDSGFNQAVRKIVEAMINGEVLILKGPEFWKETDEYGNEFAKCRIDAEVRESERPDPTFVLEVNNIDRVYNEGDRLSFDMKVHGKDAYLRIFWFDNEGGSVIYPNTEEENMLFRKNTAYVFPIKNNVQYIMTKDDDRADSEDIMIMMVALKRDIPYIGEDVTYDSMFEWIAKIPASDRAMYKLPITIK